MWKLLKLEWSKFSGSPVIRLLALFFILFFPGAMFFGNQMPKFMNFLPSKNLLYEFPGVWDYLGYSGNWMVFFFLGVLCIYIITNEVSYKTLRQTIINGMTRKQYFLSKLLLILTISIIATAYYTLVSLILGMLNSEGASMAMAFNNDYSIIRFFLMSLSYLSFGFFLGVLLRRSGVAVFVYLTTVFIIEPLVRTLLSRLLDFEYTYALPMKATSDLMPFPLLKHADFIKNLDNGPNLDTLDFSVGLIFVTVYCMLWFGLSYLMIQRRDL